MHCAVRCGPLLQWLGIAVEFALNNNHLCSNDIYLSASDLKRLNYANVGRSV